MSRPTPTVHRVPWADRFRVANELMGLPGGIPMQHHTDADAFVTKVVIRGADWWDNSEGEHFETAVITAEYAAPEWAS